MSPDAPGIHDGPLPALREELMPSTPPLDEETPFAAMRMPVFFHRMVTMASPTGW